MANNIQQFDHSVDVLKALLWQYNEAENLQNILTLKQVWYNTNQQAFWEDWEKNVFDLRTANDFGLAVWSIILGLRLETVVQGQSAALPTFGFGNKHKNFKHGNFRRAASGSVSLTTPQKRLVLQLRYEQLVSKGAIPEINQLLARVFGDQGTAYVLDGLNMTMTYIFSFTPSSQLQFILEKYDVLPRPAGVKVFYTIDVENAFGFDAPHVNFDHGNFKG